MTYTGLELFMDNLKQLIYSKDNPLINHQSILCQRPQINLLYKELGSIIQILFVDHGNNLVVEPKQVRDLKKRFKYAAEEAHDIIDLFVSAVHFRNRGHFPRCDVFKTSLNLEEVMRLLKSIKEEFMTMNINNMKMDSSITTDSLQMQSAGTSCSRNPLETEKFLEEIVVGFDLDADLIRDKLVEDTKKLDVVSIVGMGGIGKTTLATKVFNDPFVVYHFHARAWVTVSQTYKKRDFLIKTLVSLGVELDPVNGSDSRLREMLHKRLMGIRFLIVIDDIWSIEAWADLKLFFPHENTGSRILITTRLTEVALHANRCGFIHFVPYLTKEKSWELLSKKVFHGDEFPEQLIKPGKRIAKGCQGLPLAVLVIAGILAKEPLSIDLWEKISHSVSSYIVSDHNRYLETLALSYQHLPLHLRQCFLYLGGFPENDLFIVRKLIWLWVAEGFIQEDGHQSLEDIAESYLMDLVNRNFVIVAERKFNGGVKTCKVHGLVRNLCLEQANKERFFLKIEKTNHRRFFRKIEKTNHQSVSYTHEVLITYKQRRVFTDQDIYIVNLTHPPTPSIRSLFVFQKFTLVYDDAEYFRSFALLRVLDLQKCELNDFPHGITLLVHLRYLAIWHLLGFPSSICNLWSLQTLIIKSSYGPLVLPSNISNLVNLRHLRCNKELYLPSIKKPMNLQTISHVVLGDGIENFQKCFPSIKKLASPLYLDEENDFELLPYLETLKLTGRCRRRKSTEPNICGKNLIKYPATLKKLTLIRSYLPVSDISIIQSLPNLEVLKLMDDAFHGTLWNIGEKEFRQLKFLRLEGLNIKQWEAYSINFPCLKQLELVSCYDLEEIPLDIGDIPTLELIKINDWRMSVVEFVERIQEQQHAVGNFELKINVDGMDLSFISSLLAEYPSVVRSVKKIVLILDLMDERIKQKAMKSISSLPGVESIAMNSKNKLTVTGDVDPVALVSKLRKFCHTKIVYVREI